jgi:hypothetical protein
MISKHCVVNTSSWWARSDSANLLRMEARAHVNEQERAICR